MERIKRSETIGYKIRLLHNQLHKNMEAKREENEDNLTGSVLGLKSHGVQHACRDGAKGADRARSCFT